MSKQHAHNEPSEVTFHDADNVVDLTISYRTEGMLITIFDGSRGERGESLSITLPHDRFDEMLMWLQEDARRRIISLLETLGRRT